MSLSQTASRHNRSLVLVRIACARKVDVVFVKVLLFSVKLTFLAEIIELLSLNPEPLLNVVKVTFEIVRPDLWAGLPDERVIKLPVDPLF